MKRLWKRIRRDEGQALVEFAFVLPLLMLFLFGIIDFGLAVNNYNADTNLANLSARMMSVLGSNTTENCGANSYSSFGAWLTCEASATGAPTPTWYCASDTTNASSTKYTVGDPVEVKVQNSFGWLKLITNGDGYIGGVNPTTNITGSATMRIESAPASTNTFLTKDGTTAIPTC